MDAIITDTYSVYFNKEGYKALNQHLKKERYSKLFLLTDENTHRDCLPLFLSSLETDLEVEIIEMEAGETHKTIDTCVQIWYALSELGADRRSLMINLGGGVVTDLGGFVACTFKRGIPFINVPTSLLAMVDASIGGKTGVDLGNLKNQIGVIRQPEMVLVMVDFLKTLEKRQLNSGFAEMFKHGLISSGKYWSDLKDLKANDPLESHIYRSVQIKNKIVLEDPTEKDMRKILNFGHTLGHAIESHFLDKGENKALLHGEAIAVGMILEGYLSHRLSSLGLHQLEDIKNTLLERFRKVDFTEEDKHAILALLKFDKKNSHGSINFVLLKRIGDAVIDQQVPEDLFMEAFTYYEE
ncbi:3-dehydroquinate synthase [Muriicola jejuensis]|uniref:3-dehydroquinate synthase n=1 Tax=Muriicola jejuensis TaxID=504488 RepID=A0A6P0UFI3_9FLAO|nr:3-dehydroquinate synthase [Muriicola jejuensis]NER11210.1 3-dehydroquinate synthase [Muriicola jejuensis]SMP24262.1 3-dehydroquinate synthase [Muriicola jejuensis]